MGIGFNELILIFFIVLILFGPGKLPDFGKAIGRGIKEFKRAQSGLLDDDQEKIEEKKGNDTKVV